ncbi:(2R)-3-sulfolactate dehydrogenase (NADP+) [Rhodoblastus acidophilus]|uniref:Ldh family oxidoreductase n=1 Tax=Rhodoblastus acidophilus TaxID=1074 RepID=UPI002224BA59|nr:Ldh family oxidoreductase [Rhodoblastus acidophilus]MCW2318694.1 (2R)-3-sulfolactate dehydrogenase (NADP+) [Rhodoblastus acidophilus]
MRQLSLRQAEALAQQALRAAGAPQRVASSVAQALVAAEADGLASHGLMRLPYYADQAASGKVRAAAEPVVERRAPALLHVDAREGFAYPAIELALAEGGRLAREQGLALAAVGDSHHAGVMGHHVEAAARDGLVALAFANTQAALAPWGGKKALFGTNPIAFACPRATGAPLVIDLSVSAAARGKIVVARDKGESIPPDWAFDPEGRPTTDPAQALKGALAPFGGAKGACLALMVEILAGALTGSAFSHEAGSMFDAEGAPPRLGQLFLLIDPQRLGGAATLARVESLLAAMLDQDGVRLPGARRLALREKAQTEGIRIPAALFEELSRRAAQEPAKV